MNTLTHLLQTSVKSSPKKICMQIKTETRYNTLTYQQFYDQATSIAQALINTHIQEGDRIAIIVDNGLEWGAIYFGILMAGAIAVPIDPQSTPEDLLHYLEHSETKMLFINDARYTILQNELSKIAVIQKIIILDKNSISGSKQISYTEFLADKKPATLPTITENQIASILYTSGTTGTPKGVMLSHKNFCANFQSVDQTDALPGQHNFLSILPLHHAFPFMATLIFPLFKKNKITYLKSLKQEEIFKCIKEAKITALIAVPQLFQMMAQNIEFRINKTYFLFRPLLKLLISLCWLIRKTTRLNLAKYLFHSVHKKFGRQFKFLGSGGAKLSTDAEILLNKIGFTLVQGYGLTETAPVVTFNPIKHIKIGSAGKPIHGVTVKIDHKPNEKIGEVLIQGDNVMEGYYENPEETNQVIRDGWFYSGDLGYLDSDNYLFLTGRKKEVIVLSNGKNIYPDEIELFYLQSHYIKELCILSVSDNNTEKLMAVILPDFDYFKKINELDIDFSIRWDLENYSKRLPAYKRIMGYILIKEELPKTRLGKLKRYEISEKYLEKLRGNVEEEMTQEPLSPEDLALSATPEFENLTNIIKEQKPNIETVNLNDHLEIDLAFDSLSRTELLATIEHQLNITFDDKNLTKIYSVKDLLLEIQKQASPDKKTTLTAAALKTKATLWKTLLEKEPSKSILKKIELNPSSRTRFLNVLTIGILKPLFHLFFKFNYSGIENLPKEGPYLICSNHVSFLDAFFVAVALPKEIRLNTFFLGYSGYFDAPIIKHIVKSWRIIPIDPNARLMDAMQATYYILKQNKIAAIFPEARRSIDGTLQSFKQGVGILAKELNLPIVPINIKGAFEAWPRTQRFPSRHPVSLEISAPISAKSLIEAGKKLGAKDDYQAITEGLFQAIKTLQDHL